MQRGCNMKSGVGFLAFRLCRWASVLLIILLSLLVVSCDLWNKDMLGYLKYWSETVQLGKVEVSDATIQKNDAGADTISVAATPTIAVYVVNPQGYGLLAEIGDSSSADKSVRVSSPAVQSKALVVAHEATLLKVQLGSADGSLEHTEFRVDFEAIRKDTMQSSGQVMGVTLRYNTPPVAPIPLVKTESGYTPPPMGQVWEADRTNGILYWAYDDSITKETDPNCAKWFSINGTRHPVAGCKVPDVQVDGLSVFQFKTNYGSISVAAVDSEGVSSPAVASGQAVPPATYVIKYDGNGADGGTAPTSQSKTQYTDITLATNSGGLTRIGYRFTGWNTDPEGTGMTYLAGAAYSADEGVTLYAQWEAVDAVVLTPESGAVNHGATVTLTPPKSDATIYYQIGGADETAGAPGQPVTVTLYNASNPPQNTTGEAAGIPEGGNVTLTAHAVYADGTQSEVTTGDYRLNQYAVGYEGNGNGDAVGNVPAPQTFYSGGSVAIGGGVNRPERIGYRFTGWNTDPDGAGTTYSAGAAYSADEGVTLYAQWEAVDAVTFSRDGAVNSGDTVQLTPPKAEVTIYYSTDGGQNWQQGQLNQSVTINLYNEKSMPQSQTGVDVGIPEGDSVTITAYAKYADGTKSEVTTGTYSLNKYAVRYEGNGNTSGDVPAEQTFYSGGSVAVQGGDYLKKTGYTFAGWNTKAGGTGTLYREGDSYTDDASVTLYAQWKANTYTVKFVGNGSNGGSMDPQQFTYDKPQQLTAMQFTRTDYEFTGWNTQANGRGTSYTDGQSISNLTDIADGTVTLYAQWKIAVITLDASTISSADDLRTVLANYSNCKITVDLDGKQLEVTNSDLATNTEFFTVKDGNKVTITNGTVVVTGDFSSVSGDFFLFSVKTGSTLDLSGCTLTGTNFGNAGGTAVEVSDGGSLTLTNTTISNFESNGNGAGVRVISGGSAIMNSGAIKNNNARYGAAVYLTGSFTMNGGEISGNTNVNGSSISGSGTFKWNGGPIYNNTNGSAEGGSAIGSKINYGGTKNKNDAS